MKGQTDNGDFIGPSVRQESTKVENKKSSQCEIQIYQLPKVIKIFVFFMIFLIKTLIEWIWKSINRYSFHISLGNE